MRRCWLLSNVIILLLVLNLFHLDTVIACGPGRGVGRRRGPRKLTPLVFKQHVPNVPENTLTASGLTEGRIGRNDTRFKDLVPNYNQDIIFKDEEGTGADRLMTQRCKEKLNTLAISVMNQWPGVRLLVTEGWDEEGYHSPDSLHYEGRAVDITTSDRDRSKYGMLARLAVEAGFDWVYYESRAHIHCSVKSESSQAAKYGGCFAGDTTVITSNGQRKNLHDLEIGERILTQDLVTKQLIFSEVLLFLDYDPDVQREFLQITLNTGRTLTVTPSHIIIKVVTNNNEFKERTIFANNLKIGDSLLVVINSNKNSVIERIIKIEPVLKQGIFAPLTTTGTLFVNDILASCYATFDDQSIAHWAFAPIRLLSNTKQGLNRMWLFITKPIMFFKNNQQQQQQIDSIQTKNFNKTGVHWYAKLLYTIAEYLLPSHLNLN